MRFNMFSDGHLVMTQPRTRPFRYSKFARRHRSAAATILARMRSRPGGAAMRMLAVLLIAAAFALPGVGAWARGELVNIEKRTFVIKDFRLANGTVMPEVTI